MNRYVVLYLGTLIVPIPIDFLFRRDLAIDAALGRAVRFFCYATFELTSLSLLNRWTWPVVMVDAS